MEATCKVWWGRTALCTLCGGRSCGAGIADQLDEVRSDTELNTLRIAQDNSLNMWMFQFLPRGNDLF